MNSFGRKFRVTLWGESHGPQVGVNIDGCPAGIALAPGDFESDLARRRSGAAGTTPRNEPDVPIIVSGVFQGYTTGAPISIVFQNTNTRSSDYEALKQIPRPGHADFVLQQKFGGFNDYRGGGHSSGRLTLCLVAAGVVAKKMLSGQRINATLIEAGGISDIELAMQQAIAQQDSIGGVIRCTVNDVPPGWGEPFFDSAESLISHLVFSIPAVKGISFGSGFASAGMTGSQHNDAIIDAEGTTATNNAGGINGGITNGNPLYFDVAIKPTSSTPQIQSSWNKSTGQVASFSVKGRHDLCIALRAVVVVEAVAAIALADMKMVQQ